MERTWSFDFVRFFQKNMDDILFKIALGMIPGIGSVNARKLLAHCGSAEAIFHEKKASLLKIPGFGEKIVKSFDDTSFFLQKAEDELNFIQKNKISFLFITDPEYPRHLYSTPDAPIAIYVKGNPDFNRKKNVAIVGTRHATAYGKDVCAQIVQALKPHNPIIVSGLAYGIDIAAHRAALQNNLDTFAILGHGFSMLYPSEHAQTAREIISHGALITECTRLTPVDRSSFLRRNRIIAALADLTIIVESSFRGGALTTVERAIQYGRKVFAVPGRFNDEFSVGCNNLIFNKKAIMLRSLKDIENELNWTLEEPKNVQQTIDFMPANLEPDEQKIIAVLKQESPLALDNIAARTELSVPQVSTILLTLELKSLIISLPGNRFQIS